MWSEKLREVFTERSVRPLEVNETGLNKLGRNSIFLASDGCYPELAAEVYGIFPISFENLFQIAGLHGSFHGTNPLQFDEELLNEMSSSLEEMRILQGSFERNRTDHLGNKVNDHWGTMNSENLFVLGVLLAGLHRKCEDPLRGLFIGTGSGFPERMCQRLVSASSKFSGPSDFIQIDTVDYRSDEGGERQSAPCKVIQDGRNYTYGPLPEYGIGHFIHDEISVGRLPKEKVNFHHLDSSEFLSKLSSDVTYDFAVIDGNHLYAAVMADLDGTWRHLAPGGFVFLDDYGANKTATNPGVTAAAFSFGHLKKVTGYWVTNPKDPFVTNAAFFVK